MCLYIQFVSSENNKIIIEGYPYNPITSQDELDKYMEWLKRNTIKSSRK